MGVFDVGFPSELRGDPRVRRTSKLQPRRKEFYLFFGASESDSNLADHVASLAIDCPLCSFPTMMEEKLEHARETSVFVS